MNPTPEHEKEKHMSDQPAANTDRELYRETPGDYYSPSIHVTEGGALRIEVGGESITTSLRGWHHLATEPRGHPGPPPTAELREVFEYLIERHLAYPDDTAAELLTGALEVFSEDPAARIRDLVDRSSFGTPEAKALRESVPADAAARVVERARELAAEATPDCNATWTGAWEDHCVRSKGHDGAHRDITGHGWE